MSAEDRAARTLTLAEHVAEILAAHGVPSALIGAMALAVHNYPRFTEDVDLATDTAPVGRLGPVSRALAAEGHHVTLVHPDAGDPLGGVLTVRRTDCDPVQVVDYYNPHGGRSRLGKEALKQSVALGPGTSLRAVDLPHLIALKPCAGRPKSRLDVHALLRRNPGADLDGIRALCARFGLTSELERALGA